MSQFSGLIAAGDGRTFFGKITFADRIEALEPTAAAGAGDYILPGLIDLQLNGSHGIDVMTATPAEIVTLAGHLAREGTTAFLPTGVTAPLERIERVHAAIAEAMSCSAPKGRAAAILGMHLEGPFISSARLGAHPALNLEPSGEPLERVLKLASLRLVTLAPELTGALEAIRRLCARGVMVSIGHTDATFAEANAGIAAGARMFTHLFNAMRPLHHREPGAIGAAMLPSGAKPAVIPDGIHVDPAILKLLYRSRGAGGMILTSDRVVLGGERADSDGSRGRGDGDSSWRMVGRAQARVERGAARLADGTLAGSIISLLDGARLLGEKVGVSVGEAAMMVAATLASMLGIDDRGMLKVGARADLLLLSRNLTLKAVFVGGHEVN
jgi:N-acetylglucosamine-6-phosphate deacetylase